MSQTILITGVNGFVGHHLAREARSQGFTVIGASMSKTLDPALATYVDTHIGDCDLTDSQEVANLPLEDVDIVVNLAGLAKVGASFGEADAYNHVNVQVHTVLAHHLLAISSKARIIAVSTGAVYDSSQPMPLGEDSTLAASGSPYALSKVAMESALQEYIAKGLDIVIARPFNHIGPGQLPGFLLPDLAYGVLQTGAVRVGNLQTARDYTDVRDVVRAYLALATSAHLTHTVYNVCSNKSVKGEIILDILLETMGKQDAPVTIDQSFIRPHDPLIITGDNSLIRAETEWKPQIDLNQTIADFVSELKVV